jgi:hypothetical protein
MPESGLPIRVYEEQGMCTSTTAKARPKSTPAGRSQATADAVAEAEERTVVVEE